MIFIGDLHGNFGEFMNTINKYDIKDKNLIQVGDFGLGFAKIVQDDIDILHKIDNILVKRNCIMYVIRGNHDNPKFWNNNYINLTNLKLVPDYTFVHDIDGMGVLMIGGGISVDRCIRKDGFSYWKNEAMYYNDDYMNFFNRNTINVVVTHVPIVSIFQHLMDDSILKYYYGLDKTLQKDLEAEQKLLNDYKKLLEKKHKKSLKYWVSGHLHLSSHIHSAFEITGGINYIVLNSGEFYEIDGRKNGIETDG